jgi:hypothetical protein
MSERRKDLGKIIALFFLLAFSTPGTPPQTLFAEEEDTGILETDDISTVLEGEGLWIRITPLDEAILKYSTEDTRRTYTAIITSHPELSHYTESKKFLVLFQGRSEPEVYFEPTELEIFQQGNRFRPEKIISHTSTFDKRVLKFYGTPEMAIYAYSKELNLEFPITFKYRTLENKDWDRILTAWKNAKAKY